MAEGQVLPLPLLRCALRPPQACAQRPARLSRSANQSALLSRSASSRTLTMKSQFNGPSQSLGDTQCGRSQLAVVAITSLVALTRLDIATVW